MKLSTPETDLVLSNVTSTNEFKIRATSKSFSILSSGLYSNKIKAIVRELSCNAIDSHVAANKSDIPFEVHLPSMLEPWFSIRDFGTGLNHDDVINVYTTYFESTKTSSNDFIGALGLGSKSPFSYTDNFSVTAIKNNKKRIYSAFINEQGVPSIALMEEIDSNEDNGIEVKLSVTDKSDFYLFQSEASEVYSWFKLKPRIYGTYQEKVRRYTEQNIIPGIHLVERMAHSVAVMGNISYPINLNNADQHLGSLAELLNCGLEINFEIGELDFAASREVLSYIPSTISAIKNKLQKLTDHLMVFVNDKVKLIDNDWTKATILKQLAYQSLFRGAVFQYIKDTKFELIDIDNRHVQDFNFKWDLSKFQTLYKLNLNSFICNSSGTSLRKPYSEYNRVAGTNITYTSIPVTKDVYIVLNDLKTGAMARARYHFRTKDISGTVIIINYTGTDLTSKDTEFEKFLKDIHNPPNVLKASELIVKEKDKVSPSDATGVVELNRRRENYSSACKYVWHNSTITFDKKTTYYYVKLKNYEPYRVNAKGDDETFNITQIASLLDNSDIAGLSNIKIYGLRKNRLKDFQTLKNWIDIEDKIREEISKINSTHVSKLIFDDFIDKHINAIYNNANVANALDKNSPYYKFYEKHVAPATSKINSSNYYNKPKDKLAVLTDLCNRYGNLFDVEKIRQKLILEYGEIKSTYPILNHISYSHNLGTEAIKDVVQYIKFIDEMEK